MNKRLLFIFLILYGGKGYGQNNSFDFYGNAVPLNIVSAQDCDSVLKDSKVPATLLHCITTNINKYDLEDWSIVLFLKKYVDAAFNNIKGSDKTKILSALLTSQSINNAIGIRNKHRLLPLIIIDRKLVPTWINVGDEYGYKFIFGAVPKLPFKIRDVDIVFYKGKNILLKANPPKLIINDYKSCVRPFTNYLTKKIDTIAFNYSPQFIQYSYDFPIVLSHVDYSKTPISPLFTSTLFNSIDKKISSCKSKIDSINFLFFIAKTAVKYEENKATYSPEYTLSIGRGSCDDRIEMLAFLLSYYFKKLDMVFLHYETIEHVRLGIYDTSFETEGKSYVEYKGKKYLLAETTDDFTELGDKFYKGLRNPTQIVE